MIGGFQVGPFQLVFQQGPAVDAPGPEFSRYGIAFPPESPGPAPRLGDINVQRDRDFYALAKLSEMDQYVQNVINLLDHEEVVDLDEDPFGPDEDLVVRSEPRGPRRRR